MNKELHNEDKKYYISFISFSLTAIVLLAVGYVLSFIKNELEVKYILETYNISLDHFVSERSEKIQYIVLTLLFPFVFIIFYKLVDKLADKIKIGISNINAYLRLTASVIAIIGFNAIKEKEFKRLKKPGSHKLQSFLVLTASTLVFL